MKLKKVWNPARTDYRIDRTLNSGVVHKWFYSRVFNSEKSAQAFIDKRGPSYRGKLSIHSVEQPAGYGYEGTMNF